MLPAAMVRLAVALAALSLIVFSFVATAAAAEESGIPEADSEWSSVFSQERPIAPLETRNVIVRFTAPSLAEWKSADGSALTPAEQRVFVQRAKEQQDEQLGLLKSMGVSFTLRHRYVRTFNGVSLVLNGDWTDQVRSLGGVEKVFQVRTVYPAAVSTSTGGLVSEAVEEAAESPVGFSNSQTVAVLDTAIDFNHPLLQGAQASPGYDVRTRDVAEAAGTEDAHGTQMAGGVLIGAAGARVGIDSVVVMKSTPVVGELESVVGTTDDLLAGLEYAVDPDQDGDTDDADGVILIAAWVPYGSFADAPEAVAAGGARALGSIVVAAAGNDGAGGSRVGTIGAPASDSGVVAVGAVDLRSKAASASIHVRGGVLDTTESDAPVVTGTASFPSDPLPVIVVGGGADEVENYLGGDARSRVAGAVALVKRNDGVQIERIVRAAADAGAAAVLIADAHDAALSGTVTGRGTDIPALGITLSLGEAIASESKSSVVEARFDVDGDAGNSAYGQVAGFSSGGPTYDGHSKPDLVAAGVGVQTTAVGKGDNGEGATATVTGTSIAAAQVAGHMVRVHAAHAQWTADSVVSAMTGAATPIGHIGSRLSLQRQGGGISNPNAASRAALFVQPARIDFGGVTAGRSARVPFVMYGVDQTTKVLLPELLSDQSASGGPTPVVSGSALEIAVPAGTEPGAYGGWLIDAAHEIRIPWTVVVRDAQEFEVPVTATLDNSTIKPNASIDDVPTRLTVSLGAATNSLGIPAAREIDIALHREDGTRVMHMTSMNNMLPGLYTFAVTGRDGLGQPLAAGTYVIRIKVRSAYRSDSAWADGAAVALTVKPA